MAAASLRSAPPHRPPVQSQMEPRWDCGVSGKRSTASLAQRWKCSPCTGTEAPGSTALTCPPKACSFCLSFPGLPYQVPKNGWLKATARRALRVLVARNLKSWCWQGPVLSSCGGESFLAPSSFCWFSGNIWDFLAYNSTNPIFAFAFTQRSPRA